MLFEEPVCFTCQGMRLMGLLHKPKEMRAREKAGEPKDSLFVEGADHTYNRWDWQWMVIKHTGRWFEENL